MHIYNRSIPLAYSETRIYFHSICIERVNIATVRINLCVTIHIILDKETKLLC